MVEFMTSGAFEEFLGGPAILITDPSGVGIWGISAVGPDTPHSFPYQTWFLQLFP